MLLPLESILPLSKYQIGITTYMQAASKCHLNYSTAKIIMKELDAKEKKFVKRLLTKKERDEKEGMNIVPVCTYKEIDRKTAGFQSVEVISRLGFDFFAPPQKKH